MAKIDSDYYLEMAVLDMIVACVEKSAVGDMVLFPFFTRERGEERRRLTTERFGAPGERFGLVLLGFCKAGAVKKYFSPNLRFVVHRSANMQNSTAGKKK